jgi:sarcosine oxidase
VEYDAIIVGLGGMGTASADALAGRGLRVLGLDQFGLGHARGASHGRSRIVRQAYIESPNYIALLRRAYALWDGFPEECRSGGSAA